MFWAPVLCLVHSDTPLSLTKGFKKLGGSLALIIIDLQLQRIPKTVLCFNWGKLWPQTSYPDLLMYREIYRGGRRILIEVISIPSSQKQGFFSLSSGLHIRHIAHIYTPGFSKLCDLWEAVQIFSLPSFLKSKMWIITFMMQDSL